MILDSLVFTLGFLVAGLLALAVLPAVWRRAMRLSGERLSRLVPLSPAEVAADRDHLRASHAVGLRRAEQKGERAEAERASLMAEASRREDRIAALTQDGVLTRSAISALELDLAALQRDRDALQAETGTAMMALHDASGLADKRWAEIVDLGQENQRLAEQVDRDRASVAALETRLLGASSRADDLAHALAAEREKATAMAVVPPAVLAPSDAAPDASVAAAAEAATWALGEARRREIEHLTHEVAFAHEQANSAERRAAEAGREVTRLLDERAALAAELTTFKGTPDPEPGDDLDRLRAEITRLADDVMRVGKTAKAED